MLQTLCPGWEEDLALMGHPPERWLHRLKGHGWRATSGKKNGKGQKALAERQSKYRLQPAAAGYLRPKVNHTGKAAPPPPTHLPLSSLLIDSPPSSVFLPCQAVSLVSEEASPQGPPKLRRDAGNPDLIGTFPPVSEDRLACAASAAA